ncbi:MAG: hypothetical protein R2873_35715 [Caldilineaceae bacterium]
MDEGNMVLMPSAQIFYEFVPAAARQRRLCQRRPFGRYGGGRKCAPVISSVNGLWRY